MRRHMVRPGHRTADSLAKGDGNRSAEPAATPVDPSARHAERAAGTVLLAHSLLVVGFIIALSGLPPVKRLFDTTSLNGAVLNVLLTQGLFILLPTLLTAWFHKIPPSSLTGARSRPGSLILSLLVGIPAAVVFSGLNNLLLFLLAGTGFTPPADTLAAFHVQSIDRSFQELLLIAIVSILLPAVCEELMFRGLIQSSLMLRTQEGTVIFLQAFVFMLFHNNPAFLLPPFLAGLLLGLIRSRSGSLMAAITAHLSLNTAMALMSIYLPRFSTQFIENATQSGRSLLYASLIATCLAAVALVPLVVLVAGTPPAYQLPLTRRRLPVDLKFMLAILVMLVTISFEYFST